MPLKTPLQALHEAIQAYFRGLPDMGKTAVIKNPLWDDQGPCGLAMRRAFRQGRASGNAPPHGGKSLSKSCFFLLFLTFVNHFFLAFLTFSNSPFFPNFPKFCKPFFFEKPIFCYLL
jgi:hypothetical protein